MATISAALDQFLADVGEGNRKSMHSPWSIIDLFRHYLNDHGYDILGECDRARFEKEYDEGRQFCESFDAEKIDPGHLNGFVSHFVIRKVVGTRSFYKACGPLIEKLADWLSQNEYWTSEQANWFRELVSPKAGQELPACDEFRQLLYDYVESHPQDVPRDLNTIPDKDYLEEQFTITKVTPTKLHLDSFDEREIVLRLPQYATSKAKVGWSVFLALARIKDKWQILNVGNVYPL